MNSVDDNIFIANFWNDFMAHIDTLKIYEAYRSIGMDEATAKEYTNILEKAFMTQVREWLKEIKDDFASQKLVTVLGGLIVTALLAIGSELWYLSKEVSILSRDMQEVRLFMKSK